MTVVSFSMAYRSFRGGSGRLHTRLDTPPLINRRHPDSCLARPGPDTDAASPTNRGLSETPYNADGDNLRQNPRPAVVGQVEGSYDPRRRPDSATRKSLDTAVEK